VWEPSLPRTFLGRLGAGSATTPRLPHSFYRGHGDHICLGTQPAHQCDACRVGIPPRGTTNQLHHPHHYYYHGYNEMTLGESECLNTADLLRTRSEYLWGVVQGWPPRSLIIPRQPRYTAGSWLYNGDHRGDEGGYATSTTAAAICVLGPRGTAIRFGSAELRVLMLFGHTLPMREDNA